VTVEVVVFFTARLEIGVIFALSTEGVLFPLNPFVPLMGVLRVDLADLADIATVNIKTDIRIYFMSYQDKETYHVSWQ
jgi:hypothetical protein